MGLIFYVWNIEKSERKNNGFIELLGNVVGKKFASSSMLRNVMEYKHVNENVSYEIGPSHEIV